MNIKFYVKDDYYYDVTMNSNSIILSCYDSKGKLISQDVLVDGQVRYVGLCKSFGGFGHIHINFALDKQGGTFIEFSIANIYEVDLPKILNLVSVIADRNNYQT